MLTIFLIIAVTAALFLAVSLVKHLKLKLIQRRLIAMMREIAELRNLQITRFDVIRDQLLALDEGAGALIYLCHSQMENNRVIDLKEVRGSHIILKRIVVQLEIMHRDPYRAPLSVPFYRRHIDPPCQRARLTQTAQQWKKLLSNALEEQNKVPAPEVEV